MTATRLSSALEDLSNIQKEVVETDNLPLLVLAGPGSGKTRVLTCRIARTLDKTRDEKFRILGLTFTNKAADEMRTRVTNLVPGQENRLFLGTFHSFCADILRQHGTHLNINPNYHIYSQNQDLEEVLNDVVEEAKKQSSIISDLDKKTLPVIQRLKSLLIAPENCVGVLQDQRLAERMAIVYPNYESELSKRNALDFNSLIYQAYRLFNRFPAFAKRYRTVYPYICIDEFQDTNLAQYMLIKSLTGEDYENLFIVADDDQIIYQWNGASHKRIVEFTNDYSPQVIQLPMNYRCPPEIVTLANNLIQYNFLRSNGKKPLESWRTSIGKDTVRLLPAYPDLEAETYGIVEDIRRFHAHHLESVVILARNRRLLDAAERALRSEGIQAIISQRKDEFESPPFVWLHSLLRLANDRQNSAYLEAICGSFSQLVGIEVEPDEVITQAKASNRDYLQHWVKVIRRERLGRFPREAVDQISHNLGEGRDYRSFTNFALAWFDRLIDIKSRSEEEIDAEVFARYHEERAVWEELRREITQSLGEELTLEAFLQELQMHSKESPPGPNTLVLMTIHGAKGKEFDHVYLMGLVDDELPSFQSKKKGDDSPEMEEERRNCFVAITRAMETLTLSFSEEYKGWHKEPSRFLFEMGLLK